MAEAVNQATQTVNQMDNAPSALVSGEDTVNNLNTVVGQIVTIAEPLTPLLEKLQLFADVVDKIAEVCDIAEYIPGFSNNGSLCF
jgi:hypothetical protein